MADDLYAITAGGRQGSRRTGWGRGGDRPFRRRLPGHRLRAGRGRRTRQIDRLERERARRNYAVGPDHPPVAEGPDPIGYNADAHRTIDRDYVYELDALDRVRCVLDRSTSMVVAELSYDPLSRVRAYPLK